MRGSGLFKGAGRSRQHTPGDATAIQSIHLQGHLHQLPQRARIKVHVQKTLFRAWVRTCSMLGWLRAERIAISCAFFITLRSLPGSPVTWFYTAIKAMTHRRSVL